MSVPGHSSYNLFYSLHSATSYCLPNPVSHLFLASPRTTSWAKSKLPGCHLPLSVFAKFNLASLSGQSSHNILVSGAKMSWLSSAKLSSVTLSTKLSLTFFFSPLLTHACHILVLLLFHNHPCHLRQNLMAVLCHTRVHSQLFLLFTFLNASQTCHSFNCFL